MRYPTDIGCTGQAIQEKRLVYFNTGDPKPIYSGDIDNCNSLSRVDSMLIGPIFDKEGELKGVLQLLNKKGGEKIGQKDLYELSSLLPALAEIFSTAEMVKQICDISGGVTEYMIKMKQHVIDSAASIECKQMSEIAGSV